jgi:formylglycine-generating enzyme required for sulfatase activity
LDKYEVTVGRFRKFVAAYSQSMIAAGAGKNANNPNDPGWDVAWNASLPASAAALTAAVKCTPGAYQTWTDAAASNENRPINCLTWYEAHAFCAWDGGRLPTEAEWNYAATGGSEQRMLPWGSAETGAGWNMAVWACYYNGAGPGTCTGATNIAPVGYAITGNGKWGQSDLAGNLFEWNQDWFINPYPTPCDNCAHLSSGTSRVIRGGAYYTELEYELLTVERFASAPTGRGSSLGFRCARNR